MRYSTKHYSIHEFQILLQWAPGLVNVSNIRYPHNSFQSQASSLLYHQLLGLLRQVPSNGALSKSLHQRLGFCGNSQGVHRPTGLNDSVDEDQRRMPKAILMTVSSQY